MALFHEPCQARNVVGGVSPAWRLAHALRTAVPVRSTVRTAWKRLRAPAPAPAPRLGAPSRFSPGDWVRVRDPQAVRATLDAHAALRGLVFVSQQWDSCGRVFRVLGRVQRILDDRGQLRPVARTVTLEGAGCGGHDGSAGCGRDCPLFYRDEWLEPAAPPSNIARPPVATVRVRSREEIAATLDADGRLDGLLFMPEMYRFAGQTLRLKQRVARVYELARETTAQRPIYILEGLFCEGGVLGAAGPCDRRCALLWDARWLELPPGGDGPTRPPR